MHKTESDQYHTIEGRSEGLFRDRGSRFIAVAIPARSVDEVSGHLEALRKEYHDARHHCYAYRLGKDGDEYRQNDDGEPSGTAGRPILGQIQSFGLTNILVVVVRYFGGTRLGTGGLINAYKTASREALEVAQIKVETLSGSITLKFEYPLLNDVMRIVKDEGLDVKGQQFGLGCEISLGVRMKDLHRIRDRFESIYGLSVTSLPAES